MSWSRCWGHRVPSPLCCLALVPLEQEAERVEPTGSRKPPAQPSPQRSPAPSAARPPAQPCCSPTMDQCSKFLHRLL